MFESESKTTAALHEKQMLGKRGDVLQ